MKVKESSSLSTRRKGRSVVAEAYERLRGAMAMLSPRDIRNMAHQALDSSSL